MNKKTSNQLGVIQLIDNLGYGGAENMAVQIANSIDKVENIDSFLCATREGGVYEENIGKNVDYIVLNKNGFFDFQSLKKLKNYIVDNNISIIQAHSSSIYWALIIKLFTKNTKLIWHNHSGMSEFAFSFKNKLRNFPIKILSKKIGFYIVVNEKLREWNEKYLKVPSSKIFCLQNYPVPKKVDITNELLDANFKYIICLANIRTQKGHPFLIDVVNKVFTKHKNWKLILVGKDFGGEALENLNRAMEESPVKENILWLGGRSNVGDYLQRSSIAVLSSISEGLPVALLEYGLFKLPVVSTKVGQVTDVVTNKGLLVDYGDVEQMEKSINSLIENEKLRERLGEEFNKHIVENFSEEAAIKELARIYSELN